MTTKVQKLIAAANAAAAGAPQGLSYDDAERYGPQAVGARLGELEDWQQSLVRNTFMHAYLERERARMKKDRAMRELSQR